MNLRPETKKSLLSIANTTGTMVAVGILYALLFARANVHTLTNGILIGGIVGLGGSVAEIYIFSRYRQRFSFMVMLVARSIYYVVLVSCTVAAILLVHAMWEYETGLSDAFGSPESLKFLYDGEFVQVVVYALAMSFVINFVRQVNRLLGHNALLTFITGKYHQPLEEDRIFMFLDLKSSTSIAEKLGNKQYHNFLNDFFHDISSAIVESQGAIYQYVGDEVVVTWTKEKGLKDANCIRCYFMITASIRAQNEKYKGLYGFLPTFKAGFHYGPVIAGEIGDIKREIVYHGDTVNTAARIRSECTKLKKDLLLSAELLKRLKLADSLSPESIGKIRLRGKTEDIELYTILETP